MSLTSDIGGIFGQLSNGVQSLQTTLDNAIGSPTPPNSAPAPTPTTAGVGNSGATAKESNGGNGNNTMLYIGGGIIVGALVLYLILKK